MQMEQEIKQFIGNNFILGQDVTELSNDDSLTQTGIIDSMGVLELILFLEERYGIKISDEDALPENLDTIHNILRYLHTKLSLEALENDAHDRPSEAVL